MNGASNDTDATAFVGRGNLPTHAEGGAKTSKGFKVVDRISPMTLA